MRESRNGGATIMVNGQERGLPSEGSLFVLLGELGIRAEERGVAVAVGGQVVPRQAWMTTRLSPGDEIEVLRAVQGG